MTQSSRPQPGNLSDYPAPSDPGPYNSDAWADMHKYRFTRDPTTQGPLIEIENELEVTDNGSNAVYVDTGRGIVNGHDLKSDEKETWTIPAGPAGGRTDRVVMVENNTNVEVTQSTAARPLLFPADLSEYTATPGVPAYSARLAILRGNDAGALPALDQTNNLYMVELARYDINNVPTISSQVDYREWCLFSSSVGERQFVATALVGDNYPYAPLAAAPTAIGVELQTGANEDVQGIFMIPSDYESDMVIQAVYLATGGAGNINFDAVARYGTCSESYVAHTDTLGATTLAAVTTLANTCIADLTLTNATAGDVIQMAFIRNGAAGADTYGSSIFFVSWLITYKAKS